MTEAYKIGQEVDGRIYCGRLPPEMVKRALEEKRFKYVDKNCDIWLAKKSKGGKRVSDAEIQRRMEVRKSALAQRKKWKAEISELDKAAYKERGDTVKRDKLLAQRDATQKLLDDSYLKKLPSIPYVKKEKAEKPKAEPKK